MAGDGSLVVAKLNHRAALRRLATGNEMLAAPNQKALSVFRERGGIGLDVFLVAFGIVYVDVNHPVALRHASNSLDQHDFDFRRAFAQSSRRLILLGMKIAPRRLVALEFQNNVARSRFALQGLAAPAARERLAAMVGDSS